MADKPLPEFAARFFDRVKTECLPRIDRATVAFYGIQDDEVKQDRTGVLYKIAGQHFILTAAHYLKDIVEQNIPLYIDLGDGESLPVPLAEAKFSSTEVEGRDVAVISLPDDVVGELVKTKEFLLHSDIRLMDEREKSLYIVFGFPNKWSGVASETSVVSHALIYAAHRYLGEREAGSLYDPNMHIVLELEQDALNTADGAIERLPRLHGISGCGIWRVAEYSRQGFETWQPDQVSLVAIQHSWYPIKRYVQGTWINHALGLLKVNYPDVSAAMSLAYARG